MIKFLIFSWPKIWKMFSWYTVAKNSEVNEKIFIHSLSSDGRRQVCVGSLISTQGTHEDPNKKTHKSGDHGAVHFDFYWCLHWQHNTSTKRAQSSHVYTYKPYSFCASPNSYVNTRLANGTRRIIYAIREKSQQFRRRDRKFIKVQLACMDRRRRPPLKRRAHVASNEFWPA